jgi:transketolase
MDAIIIATGSELALAVEAQGLLVERGVRTRVVSMPCWELFEQQDEAYRNEVLPADVRARLSVEAGQTVGWERWIGEDGDIIGIHDRFGSSAPGAVVLEKLGFTAENVAGRVSALVERLSGVRA